MGNLVKLIAVSTPLHVDTSIGLIPLVTILSLTLVLLLVVVGYGFRRVKLSEGLVSPIRVELSYVGPALTWAPTNEPPRRLVAHDALGLGSDLSWLKNRDEIPASLAPHSYSSEPIVALELAAKVFATNLPVAGAAAYRNSARSEKIAAQSAQSEKLAALRNSVPAAQSRGAAPAASGHRPRTAVLRAADPRPLGAGASPLAAADTRSAPPVGGASSAAAVQSPVLTETVAQPNSPKLASVATASVGPAVRLNSPNSEKIFNSSLEGRVTDYSFADFLPCGPEPALPGAASSLRPSAELSAQLQDSRASKSQRVSMSIPVGLRGQRDGGPFEVETRTSVVLPQGAIVTLPGRFEFAHELILVNRQSNKQVRCQVASAQSTANGKTQVTLAFAEPSPQFWPISFPSEKHIPEPSEGPNAVRQPGSSKDMHDLAALRG